MAEATTASADFEPQRAGRLGAGRPAQLLAELFEAHAAMVLGMCRGMLRHAHDAEDAAQQTFLSAYASLVGGTVPREPAAWLATIARNECRTRVHKQMREPVPGGAEVAGEAGDPADQVVRAEEVASLRHALAGLPGQQRHAFLLREFSGLSYDELAGELGVTRPAVESLLFRARQSLRVSLRTAMAGVTTVPASFRDWVAQLFGSSPETPATVAKIGSLSIMAKIAAATAGTALLTAGAVVVAPHGDHAGPKAEATPKPAAVGRRVVPARPAARHRSRVSASPLTATLVAVHTRPRRRAVAAPAAVAVAPRPVPQAVPPVEDAKHGGGQAGEPKDTTAETRTSGDGHSKNEGPGSSSPSGETQTQSEPQHQDGGSDSSGSSDHSGSGDSSPSSGEDTTHQDSGGDSGNALVAGDGSHDAGS